MYKKNPLNKNQNYIRSFKDLIELIYNTKERDFKTLRDFDRKPIPSIWFDSEIFQTSIKDIGWKGHVHHTIRLLLWTANLINNKDDENYFCKTLTELTSDVLFDGQVPTPAQLDHFFVLLAKIFWPSAWLFIHTQEGDW